MLKMTAQQTRAMELINEWLETIANTYTSGSIEGWYEYEDWGDVEYRSTMGGEYRGVVLYSEKDDNGLIVEIDTDRETITVLDSDYKVVMVESVADNTTAGVVFRWVSVAWIDEFWGDGE